MLILLLYIIYILSLTLGNALSVEEECQIFYSIIEENNGRCNENSFDPTGTESYAIVKNGHINKLYLSSKEEMEKIPSSIIELSELEHLSLYRLGITDLPMELSKLKKLKELTIQRVCFEKIPPVIGELSLLEKLSINQNEINIIKEIPEELYKLKKLKELCIDGVGGINHQIEKISPSIGKLTELEILHLQGNKIKTLPEELFELKKLKHLDLDYNKIEEIPSNINELTELNNLNLQGNKIKTLPEELFELKLLKELNLSGNEIKEISSSIGNLTELERLYLSDNYITELPDSINILKKLEQPIRYEHRLPIQNYDKHLNENEREATENTGEDIIIIAFMITFFKIFIIILIIICLVWFISKSQKGKSK